MRALTLIGIVLLAVGGFIAFRGLSYSSREDVLKVGGLEVTAEQRRPVPTWIGGVVALVGLGLVVAGTRSRR